MVKNKENSSDDKFNANKEGMLADLRYLEREGVKVTDCGKDGIKIENFGEGIDTQGAYIIDKERLCHKSKRVYPKKRGYQLYTSDKKNFYFSPV